MHAQAKRLTLPCVRKKFHKSTVARKVHSTFASGHQGARTTEDIDNGHTLLHTEIYNAVQRKEIGGYMNPTMVTITEDPIT